MHRYLISTVRTRSVGMLALLLLLNAGIWAMAFIVFRHFPLLIGTALLAYTFGLRHAVDADHIAAIDNVTRKLMQQGQRPVAVGFFFSLGHSTVVFGLSFLIAIASISLNGRFAAWAGIAGTFGTCVSVVFLLGIAAANTFVLVSIYRTLVAVRKGENCTSEDLDLLLCKRGFFSRIFRVLFKIINRSSQMYIVGFLFGLGFDTATEVGLLGISAKEGAAGLPIWSILIFPLLFTAAMALIDTADGIIMLGAYDWAFVKPLRKLYYNLTVTLVSVVVAVLIGGIELMGLIGDKWKAHGHFWDSIAFLNDHFGVVGFAVISVFLLSWFASILISASAQRRGSAFRQQGT